MKKTYLFLMLAAVFVFSVCPLAEAGTLDKAMISFTFDDGYRSLYSQARPQLNKYKIPATAYIVTDYVGYGYAVTYDQLWKLHSNLGWEIGNHTLNHPDLTTLTDEDVLIQVRGARDALASHGLINVTSLASPYGAYNEHVLNILKSDGSLYSQRRAWWEDSPINEVDTFDQWQLIVVGMDDAEGPLTFDTVKPYIDQAIASKAWLILMFHDIVTGTPAPYQFNAEELGKIANYVNTNKSLIDAVTVSKGVGKMLYYKSLTSFTATTTSNSTSPQRKKVPAPPPANSSVPGNIVNGRP